MMTVTIDLKPEIEAQLREAVTKAGIDTSAFVARTLEERLQPVSHHRGYPRMSLVESNLLHRINQGFSESLWQEYDELIAKRRAETLTAQEQNRLIVLADSIDEAHVERLGLVGKLAQIRNVSFKTLIGQLGIKPRQV